MSFSQGGGGAIHTDADVALSNPVDGQVLTYNTSLAKWQNQVATASDSTKLSIANNLSDLASVTTAKTNLGLSTVATSGSYADLANKPTIPSAGTTANTYAVGNDSRFVGSAAGTANAALSATDSSVTNSRAPSGSASGDLAGTYPSPTVAKLNGVAVAGTPSANQVLTASSGTAAAWATASETVTTIATAGTSQALSVPASGKITYVITASASSCALTVTGATAGTPAVITLWLKQGATGNHSWTFPAGTMYPTHTAPTLSSTAGYIDVVTLTSPDGGTTWLLVPAATQAG